MSLISRMILRDLLWTFFLSLMGINTLLVLEPLIRFSKKVSGASLGMGYFVRLIVLIQPKVLVFSLPLAVVVSVVTTYGRLNIDNELIVLRSSGARIGTLLRPAVGVVFAVTTVAFITAHWIGPLADRTLRLSLNDIVRRKLFGSIEPGVFFQNIKGFTILVKEKQEDRLKGVFIFQDSEPPRIITARQARWHGGQEGMLLLKDGHMLLPKGSEVLEVSFRQYLMNLPMPEEVVGLSRASMSDVELIKTYRGSGRVLFLLEFLRRINLPLVSFPLGLIGMFFSVSARHSGRMRGFILSILLYGAYYAGLIFTEGLVQTGHLHYGLTFLPLIVLMGLSGFLYWRVRE